MPFPSFFVRTRYVIIIPCAMEKIKWILSYTILSYTIFPRGVFVKNSMSSKTAIFCCIPEEKRIF